MSVTTIAPRPRDCSEVLSAIRESAEDMLAAAHDILNDSSHQTAFQEVRLAEVREAHGMLLWCLRSVESELVARARAVGQSGQQAASVEQHGA